MFNKKDRLGLIIILLLASMSLILSCTTSNPPPGDYNCQDFLTNPSQECIDVVPGALESLNTCVDECIAGGSCPVQPCFDSYDNAIAGKCLDDGAFDLFACGPCYEQCGINFAECILAPDPAVDGSFCAEIYAGLCQENCFINPEITCQDVIDKNNSTECGIAGFEAVQNLKSCVEACGQNESCFLSCNNIYNTAISEGCWPPNVHPDYRGFICGPCYMACALDFFECIADPNETGLSCALGVNDCLRECPQEWEIPE